MYFADYWNIIYLLLEGLGNPATIFLLPKSQHKS